MKKPVRRESAFARWRVLCQGPGDRYLHIRTSPKSKAEQAFARRHFRAVEPRDQWLNDPPQFDELVISNLGVHLERMGDNELFVALGDAKFSVWRDARGKVQCMLYEGQFEPTSGMIHPHGWKPKGRGK